MRYINILLVCVFSLHGNAQNIQIQIENSELSGNLWTFDVYALAQSTYTGSNSNWLNMNIRMDVVVPAGTTIDYTNSSFNSTYVSSTSGNNNVPGIPPSGSIELGISLDRSIGVNDLPMSLVYLGSWTFTFSQLVPGSNLVTPRPPATVSGSFYVTNDDPITRLPFGLPSAFPLPIKLTSFTAVKEGDRNALLDWRSSSESNSDYYGIERSIDGINWEPIAQVTAAGNSSDERIYSYLDRALPLSRALNQIFYYRLRLVDFDGKFEYSDVRSVIFDKVETHGDIALFPNPASHLAQLDVSGLDVSDGDIHLRVTDMSGKVVLTKDILGTGVEPINVSGWISGNYNFTVTQGEKLYNKRFIKVE